MDKSITAALLIIASVVAAILVINSTYPALVRSSNSIARMSGRMDERIETQIRMVYATAELDSTGTWQDTDSDGYFDVWVWVKNVGSARVLGIDQADVFFGRSGSTARIPHIDDAGGGHPDWSYTVENDTEWGNTATLKITLHYASALTSDTYVVKVITPSGAYDEYYFSF